MTILLRDVLDIPERSGANDYVLKLTEGVAGDKVAATIAEYVVTDQLADAFDGALNLVSAALADGGSRAAFLAGSFGSGKSHFMAVLHALLGRDARARGIRELAEVVDRHDRALADKQVLRLAFHFLDAESVERTILGGYVQQIRALHPDCELPAVHRSDALLVDAETQRELLGDAAFLDRLNQGAGTTDMWSGVLDGSGEGAWDLVTYRAAHTAAASDPRRQRLVSDLVRNFFTSFTASTAYLSIDEGLAVVAKHAQGLGYDAVTLFCDELVLWLAFKVRDSEFFSREVQKLTKFTEYQTARAIPIVTVVARQLDLARYFLESGGIGADQEVLDAAFRHQASRFSTITLGDENLPLIANRRLLQPRDDEARRALDAAFDRLDRRPEVIDVLLDGINTDDQHRGANLDAFRLTYPFSPALVSTLRSLASAMQRDRTALKVMQQLLVEQRDTLTVDSVVPVGDVFDLVVEGNNAVSQEMRGVFSNARTLYAEKLRPAILRENNLTEADVAALPAHHIVHADDRLAKTLLLSAVADAVPALRNLTAARLASLNHGSIVSRLAGQEAVIVDRRIRAWRSVVPEIHVGDDPRDPVISLKLSEVEYERVVERARGEDTESKRRELLKTMVWQLLGVTGQEDMAGVTRHRVVWRGSVREVEVLFGNIRDTGWLTDDTFRAGPGTWRFVVDYPFDSGRHTPRDDIARLDELAGRLSEHTIAWVPYHLSEARLKDLGQLVVLNYLLDGSEERWTSNAQVLAEGDRVAAREILKSKQTALRSQLRAAVREAYGAATPTPGNLEADDTRQHVLVSLSAQFSPRNPVGAELSGAFGTLVDQSFTSVFPAHPQFVPSDRELRAREFADVLDSVETARGETDGRHTVLEPARRELLKRVANPLGIGRMGETAFVFDTERFGWDAVFVRGMVAAGIGDGDPVSVAQARAWLAALDPPNGLQPAAADLVVAAWAALHNRTWFRHGAPLVPAPRPGTLTPEVELRPEPLPDHADWQRACERAAVLFGWPDARRHLTGPAVSELSALLADRATAGNAASARLVAGLAAVYGRLGLVGDGGRLATARAAQQLLAAIRDAGTDRVAALRHLAHVELPANDRTVATSITSAGDVADVLDRFAWSRLDPLHAAAAGTSETARQARAVLDAVRNGVQADQLAAGLARVLDEAERGVFSWLQDAAGSHPEPAPAAPAVVVPPSVEYTVPVANEADLVSLTAQLRAALATHPGVRLVVRWHHET